MVPHSQPTAPEHIVCKFHLDPQYNTFHWGSSVLGFQRSVTPSLEFQPVGAQLSLKAALSLAEIPATASDRCSNTGPRAVTGKLKYIERQFNNYKLRQFVKVVILAQGCIGKSYLEFDFPDLSWMLLLHRIDNGICVLLWSKISMKEWVETYWSVLL